MAMSGGGSGRGMWGTRLGFILAAAGSAVGLGNVWRFPYAAGENGGGLFVLIYLICVVLVGLPIMVAEVIMGRATKSTPVDAFGQLAGKYSPWRLVGVMGVIAGFVILSYYAVVAGWVCRYSLFAIFNTFDGQSEEQIRNTFASVEASVGGNLLWLFVFMALTLGVILGGVQSGIERASRILLPVMFLTLVLLAGRALLMDGAGDAMRFVFWPSTANFKPSSVLEAMGQAFFSLSLGMGAMLTYGSYLSRKANIATSALWITLLDTGVALIAAVAIFPIVFTFGFEAEGGPGLVFSTMPVLFAQMTAGWPLSIMFFGLLTLAALTSTISLLEVVTSSAIDTLKMKRTTAAAIAAGLIFLLGIPSALSGSDTFFGAFKLLDKSFFGLMDYLALNWMLPVGGLLIAIYVGWFMDRGRRREELLAGAGGEDGPWTTFHGIWITLLKYVVPVLVLLVTLNSVGLIKSEKINGWFGFEEEAEAEAEAEAKTDVSHAAEPAAAGDEKAE